MWAGLTEQDGAFYGRLCRHEAWKPVKARHGRATVIGLRSEAVPRSQTLLVVR